MQTTYEIDSTVDDTLQGTEGYPVALIELQYDELKQAIGVVQSLWYLEEAYDTVLQNSIEMELEVARLNEIASSETILGSSFTISRNRVQPLGRPERYGPS